MNFPQTLPIDRRKIENSEDDRLVGIANEGLRYIKAFPWVRCVKNATLYFGVSNIIALLFVEIDGANKVDKYLWVVSGDLPSAYFVTDLAKDAKSSLHVYCELMEQWCLAVVLGKGIEEAFPVEAEPTKENAKSLRKRIDFIKQNIIPIA